MKVCIKSHSSKRVNIILKVVWLISYLIAITNYQNADYEAYYVMYKLCKKSQFWIEKGYWLIENIFYDFEIDFFWFRAIYLTIAYLLILKTILHFSSSPQLVSILYFLFPFLLDIVQLRNFMASAIVMYSLHFLERKDRKGTLYFLICIILASTQHKTAMCYVILIGVKYWNCQRIKKISIYGTLGISTFILVLYMIFPQITILLSDIFEKRFVWEKYNMTKGIVWTLAGVVLELYIIYAIPKHKNDILYKVSMLSCIFLPLILLKFDMYRIYRNLVLTNYLILCSKTKCTKVSLNNIVAITYSLFLFTVQLSSKNIGNYETVTYSILTYNYFFDFFRNLWRTV